MAKREQLGPRGTVWGPAGAIQPPKLLGDLLAEIDDSTGERRSEIALCLGEWGGADEARELAHRLNTERGRTDSEYQSDLLVALSALGGPDAVDVLLEAAETGPESVGIVAISGLEGLASDGAGALTEGPDPVSLASREQIAAFERLERRLARLCVSPQPTEYVRHRAQEVLRLVEAALFAAPSVPSR